jgi:hypothetical protein
VIVSLRVDGISVLTLKLKSIFAIAANVHFYVNYTLFINTALNTFIFIKHINNLLATFIQTNFLQDFTEMKVSEKGLPCHDFGHSF